VDLALVEGQIAGAAVSGDHRLAEGLLPHRARWRRFAGSLDEAFRVRPEIRALAKAETIVCRCEDVTLGQLQQYKNWRAAKLHTRCGMGPCQGRICGPAVHHLLGWNAASVRPPVFPLTVGALADFEPQTSTSGDSL
jgi:D-hydroxyproline dehydrogenase subunit alpha